MKKLYHLSIALLIAIYSIGVASFAGWLLGTWKDFHREPEDFYLSLPYLPLLLFGLWTVASQMLRALGYGPILAIGVERVGHVIYLAIWVFVLTTVLQPLEKSDGLFIWGAAEDLALVLVCAFAVVVHLSGLLKSWSARSPRNR